MGPKDCPETSIRNYRYSMLLIFDDGTERLSRNLDKEILLLAALDP